MFYFKASFLVIALFSFSLSSGTPSIEVARFITTDDLAHDTDGMPGEKLCLKQIEIGPGISHTMKINLTAKGNGMMHLLNLSIPVYDSHDNGHLFEGFLLNIRFIDLDNDGYKDLVITGTRVSTGEKGNVVSGRDEVLRIFQFDSKEIRFVERLRVGIDGEDDIQHDEKPAT